VIGRTATRAGVASVWWVSPLKPDIVAPSVGVAMEPAPGRLRGACTAVARRLHEGALTALPDSEPLLRSPVKGLARQWISASSARSR
jgi:hypothetical protein